jgi:hypothetical protein
VDVTAKVTDARGASASITVSATVGAPSLRMVAGAATGRYPSRPAANAEAYFAHHESLFGAVPCFRSYTGPTAQLPSSWASVSGPNYGAGTASRWSWVSFKPSYTRFTQSAVASSNPGYADMMRFLDTVPRDGTIKVVTVHHETDVGTKIPDTIPSQALAKQTWWVAGRAIHDHGHPEVLYAIVAGSKDTVVRSGGLGLDPILGATWGGLSVSASTGLLREVTDVMAWDPYNMASQNGDYAANRQSPAFFFDPIVSWNHRNFPDARFAIAETGYRPNQGDLSMRPTWLDATRDYCVAPGVDALALLYFDTVVAPDKQNWLGEVVGPRSPGTGSPYTFPAGTTFVPDTRTIATYSRLYRDFPSYRATATQLSRIR